MKRTVRGLFAAAISTSLLGISVAAEAPTSGTSLTGIYTSLKTGERSGDIVGVEMFVLRGGSGLYGVLQGSEGAPGKPIVVSLRSSGSSVRFSIPAACDCGLVQGEYVAELSRTEAKLKGPGNFGERRLPRAASYWQSL